LIPATEARCGANSSVDVIAHEVHALAPIDPAQRRLVGDPPFNDCAVDLWQLGFLAQNDDSIGVEHHLLG
jgi:hypothetical protein